MQTPQLPSALRHPRTTLLALDWRWLAAAGGVLGVGTGWLLVDLGGIPGWTGFALLLGAGLWLGRDPRPRLAAPLTTPIPPTLPRLPRVVSDGGLEMVEVPAGSFLMGSPGSDDMADAGERPQHRVTLSSFRIARTTVTETQYRELMGDRADPPEEDTVPATGIDWYQAITFCNALSKRHGYRPCYRRSRLPLLLAWRCDWGADGYRLPTEAEWEYACRAGTTTRWSFGDDEARLAKHAWFKANSEDNVHPVEQKHPNPWGLYDMHGNVWEWCWDFFGGYRGFERRDPHGAWLGRQRGLRGGSFWVSPRDLRSARRDFDDPEDQDRRFGFRCVRVPARQP